MRYIIFSAVVGALLVWVLVSHPPKVRASDAGDAAIRHMLERPSPASPQTPCTITYVTLPDGRVMLCQQCGSGQVICA